MFGFKIIHLARKIVCSDLSFYIFSATFLLAATIYPLYNKIRITPPGFTYSLAQFKIYDFYIYTAIMRQGHRYWLMQNTVDITDTDGPRTLVNWFYILIGKLASTLSLPDGTMYYLVQFGLVIGLIVAVVIVARMVLPKNLSRLAYLLTFFGGIFPFLRLENGHYQIDTPWLWTYQWESAYNRLMHPPAHIATEVLFVATIICIFLFRRFRKIVWLVAADISAIAGAIFFPPLLIVLATALAVASIFYYLPFIGRSKLKKDYYFIAGLVSLLILTGSALLVMRHEVAVSAVGYAQQAAIAPGSHYVTESLTMMREYFRLFWLFGPFILLALPGLFKRFKWEEIFILTLWLTPFYLIFAGPLVGFESWRSANSMPFLTAGILAVWGLEQLAGILKTRWPRTKPGVIVFLGTFAILTLSFPQNFLYYQRETIPEFTTESYFAKAVTDAMNYLAVHAPERAVVLSLEYVAKIIPTYTDARAYGTKDYDLRWYLRGGALDPEIEAFFRGTMTTPEALAFLKNKHISFVYMGGDEKGLGKEFHYPTLAREVFSEDGVWIYQVNKDSLGRIR